MESKNKKRPQKKNKNPKRIKTGIYVRGDWLYIRYPDPNKPGRTLEDATGLTYTKQNVLIAEEMRFRRIGVDKVDSLNTNSSVSEVADLYLRKKQRDVLGSTFNGYYYRMRRVKAYFGDTPIRKLKESDIENFYDGLLLGSLKREVAKKPLDEDTVKDTKRTFGAAFQMAVDAGIASKNLARIVKLNKEILADLSGLTVNHTTNQHSTKVIFNGVKRPQAEFLYRDLSKPVKHLDPDVSEFLWNKFPEMMKWWSENTDSLLPYFPGYSFEGGKSIYKGVEVGEGGYVDTQFLQPLGRLRHGLRIGGLDGDYDRFELHLWTYHPYS